MLIVVVVVAVGGFAIGRFTNQPAVSSPAPVPSSSAAPSSSVPVDPKDAVKPSDITVIGTVAPGLWKSTVTVASGNSGEFMGVRVGWPRTVDGAIGAAMNYQGATNLVINYIDSSSKKLEARIYTPDGLQVAGSTPELLAELRKLYNLNAQGQPLGPDGKVDPNLRYYGGGEPRYGAFRVLGVTTNDQATAEVHLLVMVPVWLGVGTATDISGVKLYFRQVEYVMKYLKGADGILDWRVADTPSGENLTLSDMSRSNPGYPVLRATLGPGWAVPADSTQEPLPGALMSK